MHLKRNGAQRDAGHGHSNRRSRVRRHLRSPRPGRPAEPRPARTVPWSRPGSRCGSVDRARLDLGAAGRLGLPERGAVDLGVDEPHINYALYRWRPSWGSTAALLTMLLLPALARPVGRRQPVRWYLISR